MIHSQYIPNIMRRALENIILNSRTGSPFNNIAAEERVLLKEKKRNPPVERPSYCRLGCRVNRLPSPGKVTFNVFILKFTLRFDQLRKNYKIRFSRNLHILLLRARYAFQGNGKLARMMRSVGKGISVFRSFLSALFDNESK